MNLNSTISQEFQAANTAAKSFDASNSATAQTFDGSNTLSSIPVDWSNSATIGGAVSTIDTVSTTNNTITVAHGPSENYVGLPIGTPLYYRITTGVGFFSANPFGVVFLKTNDTLGSSTSTFQVSQVPDGDPITIEASLSGTFIIANQARTFAGNNINPDTQINLDIIKENPFPFDASNSDTETNGVGTVLGYSDTILLSVTADAGLDYYQGAMVRYSTTGSAASGLTNNRTYFVRTFTPSATPNLYNITIAEFPDSASALSPTGGSGTQTFTKIGISLDKDIVHVRNSAFQVKDMLEYSYPVDGRFDVSSVDEEKNFYFVAKAYDQHNYELSESVFTATSATGGVTSEVTISGITYRVHTFTTVGSSNFVVSSVGTSAAIDYLIVGGGGGGGGEAGGGGGAGGLIYGTLTATATTYPITVGGGGATYAINGEVDGNSSSPGANSTFAGFTALGGGRGGSFNNGAVTTISNGAAGGSGGGGASTSSGAFTSGAAASQSAPGFGSAGGGGSLRRNYFGGGGGGAGGAGESALLDYPGRGGAGRFYGDIFGTGVGQFGWFASGGAGGSHPTTGGSPQAFALSGGGGDGGAEVTNDSRGRAGLANTGGGGGGAADDTTRPPANGGVGGSGVVIVRYPITPPVEGFVASSASGGITTQVVSGGVRYNVHAFTTVGSSTFTVNSLGNGLLGKFDVLIVGGGGAGSGRHGGAGGAGGLVFVPNLDLTVGAKAVTVGAGGIGAVDVANNGATSQGANSTFNTGAVTITALGGGRGGNQISGEAGGPGSAGGSGGGGNYAGPNVYAGGAGLQPSQAGLSGAPYGFGRAGGSMQRTTNESYPGGGGGGAGGVGESVVNINGGRGGDGLSRVTILGTTYTFANMFGTGYGENFNGETFFAGGGGGGVWNQFLPLIGGRGGGGDGGFPSTGRPAADGTPGLANTGGGGGGGGGTNQTHFGGNGGSGIVIIRYPVAIV